MRKLPITASASPAPDEDINPQPVGKAAQEQILPSRHALNTLTKGDPVNRSLNNYAKNAPGPENVGGIPGSIFGMGA